LANETGKSIQNWPTYAEVAILFGRIQDKMITVASAKKILNHVFKEEMLIDEAVRAEGGVTPILDPSEIEQAAREVVTKNPENVAKYKSGNEGVFKFFVGQVMRATRGQANPQAVNDILRKLLS